MQLLSLEVDICALREQNVDALDALFLRIGRLANDALGAKVALEAHKVEGRSTVVVHGVDVEGLAGLLPLVEDPLQAGRVSMHRRLVNGKIAIFVMCIENLVFSALSARLRQDVVENLGLLVAALAHDSHER